MLTSPSSYSSDYACYLDRFHPAILTPGGLRPVRLLCDGEGQIIDVSRILASTSTELVMQGLGARILNVEKIETRVLYHESERNARGDYLGSRASIEVIFENWPDAWKDLEGPLYFVIKKELTSVEFVIKVVVSIYRALRDSSERNRNLSI
jgi:hypothetical protein